MRSGPTGAASSSSELAPDIEEARRFLNALDSNAAGWSFQTFDDSDEKRGELVRILHGSLDRCWPKLVALNAAGAGIFVTINEVERGQRRCAENIRRVRALFIDCDDPGRSAKVLRKVDHCGLAPQIVVETSAGKCHVYWLVEDCPLDQFSPAQQQLVALFGTDPSVCDLPRVIRLPGLLHRKGVPYHSRLATLSLMPAYPYPTLAAVFGLQAGGSAGPISRSPGAPAGALALGQPNLPMQLQLRPRTGMLANAFANLVNLAEVEAASQHIDGIAEYLPWRNRWLLPMAAAVAHAHEHQTALYEIFDRVNRRTADPAKACENYFARARMQLDKAIAGYWKRPPEKRFGYNKIISLALDAGWDGRTAAHLQAGTAPFFVPLRFDRSQLDPVTWLVPGLLLCGETSILSGQGGGAKTALAVLLGVTLAAGLVKIGPFDVDAGQRALKVGYISAEEDQRRMKLLVAAASKALSLSAPERARVETNLRFHDAQASGWRLGKPRPNHREENSPEEHDQSLQQLRGALPGTDVLILDTLAALFALANENDNHAITNLMQRLNRVAREANCAVLLLHHTPKMTREVAASLRGEAKLARGGSAITNSARVALSITTLPSKEKALFANRPVTADGVRRLDHIKINDMAPMAPTYLELVSQRIKVRDGSEVSVRAVRFIAVPTAAATGITNAVRQIVMKAVDAGTTDKYGRRVPLIRTRGGPSDRDAVPEIAKTLVSGKLAHPGQEATQLATRVLNDLMASGCVIETGGHSIPQYRRDGRPNGAQPGRRLETQWHLASWSAASTMAPQGEPGAPPQHQPRGPAGVLADAAAVPQMGVAPPGGVADPSTGAPATKSEQASAPIEHSGVIVEMNDASNSAQPSAVKPVNLSTCQPPVQAFTGLTGQG